MNIDLKKIIIFFTKNKLKLQKLIAIFSNLYYLKIFIKFRVAPSIEHLNTLMGLNCKTIVDVGANMGQFSILAIDIFPDVKIFAFEPLDSPFKTYSRIFKDNSKKIKLFRYALTSRDGVSRINISKRNDSSSLLDITDFQNSIYKNTYKICEQMVETRMLDSVLKSSDVENPSLIKIDVQGGELEVLLGSINLLEKFNWIYVECSYEEFYKNQPRADDIIEFLGFHNFKLEKICNQEIIGEKIVQADFLFKSEII
ncbi:FkbM family methyltransferase [Polynucleobacter sp. CS-Odin-A6]|uniref:FkbM family methyltransferase n=1 Tax=Polynucleobacter sp. CS-Odin-A6 TaxID=2689106 RepID=UPI001C0D135F|nr:FkbM family methyltransferase [Polynucleobacter sp. CS-Odin-A6]MBU3621107.1 FkbM family methyltransferase [Polynucleobacter sp. CS-Odin-A6]